MCVCVCVRVCVCVCARVRVCKISCLVSPAGCRQPILPPARVHQAVSERNPPNTHTHTHTPHTTHTQTTPSPTRGTLSSLASDQTLRRDMTQGTKRITKP